MKIKILRSNLADGLKTVQNIVTGKTTLPVLQNVLLEAKDNVLTMTTTDLDMTIRSEVSCDVLSEGSTTLPVKLLSAAVLKLDEGEIEIDVDSNERATITNGNAKYKLVGLPENGFPKLSTEENDFIFKIQQSTFKEMLRKTSYAAAQDDTRRTLKGVLVKFNNQKLTLVATDGRRLAMIEQELEYPASNDTEIVLPQKAVIELMRSSDSNEEIEIRIQKGQVSFCFDKTVIYSKLIEDKYPNYEQVIPKQSGESITVDRLLLLNALERASVMTMDEAHSTKLIFEENKLRVMSATSDVGEASDEVVIKYTGETIESVFNPSYIIDTLKVIDDDEVIISLKDGHTPALIKCSIPFLYVLMPLRISN